MTADTADGRSRRWRGDRGMAMVTGLVLLFAFTSAGVIWLARDVDRKVSNRSAAQSIAFQAARSAAQQVGHAPVRNGGVDQIDTDRAESAARTTAAELFDGYGLEGEVVRVSVSADVVEVEVRVDDPAGDVTGVGAATARSGP